MMANRHQLLTATNRKTIGIQLFLTYFDVRFVTSGAIATGRKYRCRFATGGKLILFKHISLSFILVNNRVIVIENRQKNFQLQLSTFENFQFQLQLQENRVINYNYVNYNYTFSKPDCNYFFSSRFAD